VEPVRRLSPHSGPRPPHRAYTAATCKDYETGSHQDMLDIAAAVHQALKGDPNFGSLSETALLDGAIDKVCIAQPDAKVIDVLRLKK
jgi:hypothetical protein